jgi:hypothetical protein
MKDSFYRVLLATCVLILSLFACVTAVSIAVVDADKPPLPPRLPVPKLRSPKDAGINGTPLAVPSRGGGTNAVPAVKPFVQVYSFDVPTTVHVRYGTDGTNALPLLTNWVVETNRVVFFQSSGNLVDWSNILTLPYPTNGGTVTWRWTNTTPQMFYRAAWGLNPMAP